MHNISTLKFNKRYKSNLNFKKLCFGFIYVFFVFLFVVLGCFTYPSKVLADTASSSEILNSVRQKLPSYVFEGTPDFCVSGFGNSATNGEYYYQEGDFGGWSPLYANKNDENQLILGGTTGGDTNYLYDFSQPHITYTCLTTESGNLSTCTWSVGIYGNGSEPIGTVVPGACESVPIVSTSTFALMTDYEGSIQLFMGWVVFMVTFIFIIWFFRKRA